MRNTFVSSIRWVAASLVVALFGSAVSAQTVYSDNFQSYSTGAPPVAFTSTYTFVANNVVNGLNPSQVYSLTRDISADLGGSQTQHPAIGTSANTGHPGFFDHTFGDARGLFMAVNGGVASSIYRTASTFAVTPNTDYVFSMWMNSWTNAGLPTFGRVDVQLLGDVSNLTGNFLDAPPVGAYITWNSQPTWTLRTFAFNSGNNSSFTLDILDVITDVDGNDFSIDDISISAVPEPAAVALSGLGIAGVGAAVYSRVRARQRRRMLAKKHAAEAIKA